MDVKLGGDAILKADNVTITNRTHFERLIRDNKSIGDNLKLTILRDSQIKEIDLIVGSKPGPLYDDAFTYASPANVNFSYYENIELGIEIKYPSRWEIIDYQKPNSITFSSLPEYQVVTLARRIS